MSKKQKVRLIGLSLTIPKDSKNCTSGSAGVNSTNKTVKIVESKPLYNPDDVDSNRGFKFWNNVLIG